MSNFGTTFTPGGSGATPGRIFLTADRTYYVGFDIGTVTITNASPGVVSGSGIANVENNDPFVLRTSGGLPVGFTPGVVYYVKNKSGTNCELSATPGGASINTSSAGSGTHKAHSGNDNNDGLTTGRTGAILTCSKISQITAAIDKNGYSVTVKFSAGYWNETYVPKTGIGEGTFQINGTLEELESITGATVAAGSGATQGTATKTGQFAGNSYADKLVFFVTNNAYRVIDSHTNDVLTLVGTAPSSTLQDIKIYDWGTTIKTIQNSPLTRVNVSEVYIPGGTLFFSINGTVFQVSTITRCRGGTRLFTNQSSTSLNTCVWGDSAAGGQFDFAYMANIIIAYTKITLANNTAYAQVYQKGNVLIRYGSIIDGDAGGGNKATYGLYVTNNSSVLFENLSSNGYCRIRNCDIGIRAEGGSQVSGTANNQYSGNTTNESADAASFAYID